MCEDKWSNDKLTELFNCVQEVYIQRIIIHHRFMCALLKKQEGNYKIAGEYLINRNIVLYWIQCKLRLNLHVLCISKFLQTHVHPIKYNARHAHKRLCLVLPISSKIQVLPGVPSCRLMKTISQQLIWIVYWRMNLPKVIIDYYDKLWLKEPIWEILNKKTHEFALPSLVLGKIHLKWTSTLTHTANK